MWTTASLHLTPCPCDFSREANPRTCLRARRLPGRQGAACRGLPSERCGREAWCLLEPFGVAVRLIFSSPARSLPVLSQIFEGVVDPGLERLDGAAYLAQLGVHFPFDVRLGWETVPGTVCAKHPAGRPGKRFLAPFPHYLSVRPRFDRADRSAASITAMTLRFSPSLTAGSALPTSTSAIFS